MKTALLAVVIAVATVGLQGQSHSHVVQAPKDEFEDAARRLIEPWHVVDRENERSIRGHVADDVTRRDRDGERLRGAGSRHP